MKNVKRFLSLILALTFIISVMSVCFSAGAVAFTTSRSTGSLKFDYDKSTQILTVSGKGKIADSEFAEACFAGLSVKKLVMKKGITRIGNAAFSGLKIESLVIPDSVTYIGDNAFAECNKLRTVKISQSVTNIGLNAFGPVETLLKHSCRLSTCFDVHKN